MDKNFARILMLSVLLPAGASLAEAIDRDYHPEPGSPSALASPLAYSSSHNSARDHAVEGRRFQELIAAEQNAAMRRFSK